MGSNVFGTPITDEMLVSMPIYDDERPIDQKKRAKVAMALKNADSKDVKARNYLLGLQSRFTKGNVCTLCLIYNATGDTITFADSHDWLGRLCESPYPVIIANGQWGAFLHGQYDGQPTNERTSRAGFAYSALNNKGIRRDWFMSFYNSYHDVTNQVYCEIREPGHYKPEATGVWSALDDNLCNGRLVHKVKEHGGLLVCSIGNTEYPVFEAIMTLPQAI